MNDRLKGWPLLHSQLPSKALKPLSPSVYGVAGLTDVNEGYLIQRLFASELPWEWHIIEQQYLGSEDRTTAEGKPYRVYLACVQGVLVIEGRQFHGAGGHDNRKLDASFKGAATVAFKNAAKLAGLTIELFNDGRAMDFIYADDQGAGTVPPTPTSRADSGATSPAPATSKTPEEILAATKARLAKPLPASNGYDDTDAVCPSCGKKEFLRPAGTPRFCAKKDGGCGFPNSNRGETFSLISYGEYRERHA